MILIDLLQRLSFLLLAVAGLAAMLAQLPPSKNAPRAGEKAPDFTLPDSTGKPEKLSELLASGVQSGQPGSWLLLIFYRGYW